jgi:hypothetical protein
MSMFGVFLKLRPRRKSTEASPYWRSSNGGSKTIFFIYDGFPNISLREDHVDHMAGYEARASVK